VIEYSLSLLPYENVVVDTPQVVKRGRNPLFFSYFKTTLVDRRWQILQNIS
jgi:hypothetical protein